MDISTIVAETAEHEIVHPGTGDNIGLKVFLLPTTSDAIKKIVRRMTDKRNQLAARGKPMNADDQEEFNMQLVIAAIAEWEWHKDINGEDASFEGKKPDCTPANIRNVCTKLPWIIPQIDEALGDTKIFFQV